MPRSSVLALFALAASATAQWRQVLPTNAPQPRIGAAMAFDSARQQTLLFGGMDPAFGFPPQTYGDLWTWDGTTWQPVPGSSLNLPRHSAGLVYDSQRDRVVLYGGLSESVQGSQPVDQTLEWDGSSWTFVATPATPGSILGTQGIGDTAMAYDSLAMRTVAFANGNGFVGATLLYDGANWTAANPATSPPGRRSASLCSAPGLGGVLLFGGRGQSGEYNDLWIYSAASDTWTELVPAPGPTPPPTPRFSAGLLFDAASSTVVMHGGQRSLGGSAIGPLADTWTFDGLTWTEVTPSAGGMAARGRLAFADGPGGCAVLFGGEDNFFFALGDTWLHGPCAGTVSYGQGCPGGAGLPVLGATNRPVLGASYELVASGLDATVGVTALVTGLDDTTSSLGSLPAPLSPLGLAITCQLLVADDVVTVLVASAGATSYQLALPADPTFAGNELFWQLAAFDPAAQGGVAVTNAVRSTLDVR